MHASHEALTLLSPATHPVAHPGSSWLTLREVPLRAHFLGEPREASSSKASSWAEMSHSRKGPVMVMVAWREFGA
jgi:hypothetical protein